MATGACGDCNQAIDPGFCGFFCMASSGDVMEHQAAITVDGIHDFLCRAQAGDDDRDFVLNTDRQVSL